MPENKLPPDALEFFRKAGAEGGKIGGKKRAELPKRTLSRIGKLGAAARWAKQKKSEQNQRNTGKVKK